MANHSLQDGNGNDLTDAAQPRLIENAEITTGELTVDPTTDFLRMGREDLDWDGTPRC